MGNLGPEGRLQVKGKFDIVNSVRQGRETLYTLVLSSGKQVQLQTIPCYQVPRRMPSPETEERSSDSSDTGTGGGAAPRTTRNINRKRAREKKQGKKGIRKRKGNRYTLSRCPNTDMAGNEPNQKSETASGQTSHSQQPHLSKRQASGAACASTEETSGQLSGRLSYNRL